MFSDEVSQKSFYRAFEDRHRGSRAIIRKRLQAYMPFLTSLLEIYPNSPVIDLGCGRGEWLELVTECGFTAYGVDVDDGMLASCHELGLHAENKDLITALRELPDASQTVVSAFHVVEHIPFESLMDLVREAFRVLKPAGLLILETPNPENISVGTANFYVDPTHQRPIPAPLLSFLPEYTGFYRTKVVRLQEPESLREKTDVVLMDVLAGVSPDYSVVAQKPGRQSELDLFNPEFEFEYGLNLDNLASRYDVSLATRFSEIESLSRSVLAQVNIAIEQAAQAVERANHAEAQAAQADVSLATRFSEIESLSRSVLAQVNIAIEQAAQAVERANHAEAQAAQADVSLATRFSEIESLSRSVLAQVNIAIEQAAQAVERANHAEAQAAQANERANHAEAQYQAVIHSRSWKLTKPLRLAGKSARWFVQGSIAWLTLKPGSRPRRMMRSTLVAAMTAVQSRPRIKIFALKILNRHPRLKQRLRDMRLQHAAVSPPIAMRPHEANLTPRARQIYLDLKTAIEKRNREGM
ncbi:class I SAM-dependent methyltransferase [Acidithiobacillus thiooxidans]|uniref:class I SAM-dependent methyltransferase n=1 Tax=Acidithiobacillus thiooxidans TaxID=930 RepID=UPI00129E4F9F|nr:methyltransferase domain-containing protein [Acidithiobacillus thiooxidans]